MNERTENAFRRPPGWDLAGEAFVWVNGASVHSQSVAKAKYEFLFGESENENSSDSGWLLRLVKRLDSEISCSDLRLNLGLKIKSCDLTRDLEAGGKKNVKKQIDKEQRSRPSLHPPQDDCDCAHQPCTCPSSWRIGWGGKMGANAGSYGGSTLLPHNVTNEFPEYGTVEEEAKTLEMLSEFHGEALTCASVGQAGGQQFCEPQENGSPRDGAKLHFEGLQVLSKEEELPQTVDKLSESAKIPQDLQSEKAHSTEKNAFSSKMQMETERKAGSMFEEAAREKVLAGQEKPSEMPLTSEATAERKLYWITEEDSMVLTVELQPETSQTAEGGPAKVHEMYETSCHIPLAGPESSAEGAAGALGGAWADFEREFSVFDPEKAGRASERRVSKETAVSKHVEFQGVEILWIQKTEEQKGMEHSEMDGAKKHTFSMISNYHTPSAASPELTGLPERPWNVSWENFRPLASLAEGGEDEVFVTEKKNWAQERSVSEKERLMEEEEAVSGRMEDVLGQPHSEVSTDVYSSQFESILDNASLYYSAESLETLYSEPDSYFSFEMPLTPMIQQRIKEDAQFLERTSDVKVEKGPCDAVFNGLGEVKDSEITDADNLE
ncbi:PH and SEC7 domain-containing protein 3, partial [Varanus komodoensis]